MSTVRQFEEQNLFEPHQISIHCTSALTSDLPENDFDDTHVRACDVWGRGAAQIFASVSPEMHDELDIAYMRKAMEPFGLTYYGCCEPLDKKIHIVEKLPHLRKISITPWANIETAAETIGKKYVMAVKPNPSTVAMPRLNEDIVRQEARRLIDACRNYGCSCDIVLKDISTVGGNPDNLVAWERIFMEEAGG